MSRRNCNVPSCMVPLIITIFQAVKSKVFPADCGIFFRILADFIQTAIEWIIHIGKSAAQVSNGITNPVISGIAYWLILILIVGGCGLLGRISEGHSKHPFVAVSDL